MKDPKDFESSPVMGLIRRLTTFRVDWSKVSKRNDATEDVQYEVGIDRGEADLEHSNVVSSLRKKGLFDPNERKHALLIDLDVPAHLVPSTTGGHSHLYVDVAIPHHRYMALLSALADAGVIEQGYASVSIERGHSDLRLPWVEKGDPSPAKVEVVEPFDKIQQEPF